MVERVRALTDRSQTIAIDQALFGYADGHRQLASSVRLSSRDTYELASRSDLAPGAHLEQDASYIAGFSLPESRIFAFSKTWLAPEMPRPGCVWSHVLLLPKVFLSAQVNLAVLETLFVRPSGTYDRVAYSSKLNVRRLAKAAPANASIVSQILIAFYEAGDLYLDIPPNEDFDRALLAVWSQQWPKLRSEFEFRTVLTSAVAVDKGLKIRIGQSKQHDIASGPGRDWLTPAVEDAVASSVTPLRRFLWRYGKDIEKPRQSFVELVRFYQGGMGGSDGTTFEQASRLLRSLPGETNALTLKRDLLGASSSVLSHIPSVRSADFVRFVSYLKPIERGLLSEEELYAAVRSFSDADLLVLINSLERPGQSAQGIDGEIVINALVNGITAEVLSDSRMPTGFILEALRRRPDLIRDMSLDNIDASNAVELLNATTDSATRQKLLERVFTEAPSRRISLVVEYGGLALIAAVHQSISMGLHDGWREILPSFSNHLLSDGLDGLAGVQSISHTIQLCDFPLHSSVSALHWAEASRRNGAAGLSDDCAVVDAFLLILSVRQGVAANISLIADAMPRIRHAAIANVLPVRVRSFLDRYLPDIYDNWDINKRLLRILRRASQDGLDIAPVLRSMPMTDEEIAYSSNTNSEGSPGFNMSKLFWPW